MWAMSYGSSTIAFKKQRNKERNKETKTLGEI